MANIIHPAAGYGTPDWWNSPALQAMPAQAMGVPDAAQLVGTAAPANLPQVNAGPDQGLWGGIGDWFNTSGVLGKTLNDGTKVQGWGMPALNLASGLANSFFGYKQYQLAKDTLEQGKNQFNLNFDAQRKTTNAALADRQTARVAANPGAYQSVGDYMKQYGI
jgi:hypothetical protein